MITADFQKLYYLIFRSHHNVPREFWNMVNPRDEIEHVLHDASLSCLQMVRTHHHLRFGMCPWVLEALACREALALVEDIHIQKMIVASDCLQMINNLHGEYGGSYSMVTQEIKAKSSGFSENRASNSGAHRVARSFVSSSSGRQVCSFSLLKVFVFICWSIKKEPL